MMPFKKRVHLKEFNYKGYYRYFITICTFEKQNIFQNNHSVVGYLIDLLQSLSSKYHFLVWAFCFMPDHLHWLLEGNHDEADLKKFIVMFKQQSGFWYSQKFHGKIWQINYYEHVLRKDEDTRKVALYIFENPVRRGLVKDYLDYPFLGSFQFALKDAWI